ncbi:MAG: G5 domain-containing protein [Defluviitaleaceae bacterium]|nr:G5 domain-containing protein [Defluviitaleaceae bacterium]
MDQDNKKNPEAEGLRPFPKPIKLDLPAERPKPPRRLHEGDPADSPPQDEHYDYVPEPEQQKKQKPKPKPQPQKPKPTGKRYFDTVQKAYGQRRPRQRKPEKIKSPPKQPDQTGPRLGRGDRLYNPPQIKQPLISPKVKRVLKFWSLGAVAVLFIVLILMSMFRHNAWAVYLDDRFVGYMPINREVEMYTVHDDAVRHLSNSHGAAVQVNEETQVRSVRARRGEIIAASEMTVNLAQRFTYQIEAFAIYLEGERVAILRNQSQVDHVEREIQREFFASDEQNIVASFEEDWVIRTALSTLDDLDDQGEVIQLLSRPVTAVLEHTIRDGDTQGHLALEFGTTIERIGELNNITRDTIIHPGESLLIETTRPRLTVVTMGEVIILEIIPMEVIQEENPDLHISVTNILTEGRNGQRRVVQRITRVNGIQVGEPEEIDSDIVDDPVTQVEEVGTSTRAVEVR